MHDEKPPPHRQSDASNYGDGTLHTIWRQNILHGILIIHNHRRVNEKIWHILVRFSFITPCCIPALNRVQCEISDASNYHGKPNIFIRIFMSGGNGNSRGPREPNPSRSLPSERGSQTHSWTELQYCQRQISLSD